MKRLTVASVCAVVLLAVMGQSEGATDKQTEGHFVNSPTYAGLASLFNGRCVMCHSGSKPPVGLRLDSYANIRKGSSKGQVVMPGDPDKSELVKRVKGISMPRMPLSGPPWLSDAEIGSIESWIAAGAPEEGKSTTTAAEPQAPADTAQQQNAPLSASQQPASLDTSSRLASTPPPTPQQQEVKGQTVTYTQVAAIFNALCVKCHTKKGVMGPPPEGLRLDSYDVIFNADRQVVIPGSPDASVLVRAIRGQSTPRMPFNGPYLSDEQIGLISTWVAQGARDAEGNKRSMPVGIEVRLQGHLTGQWVLDDLPLVVDKQTRIDKKPSTGSYVEVRGVIQQDGSIRATRIRSR